MGRNISADNCTTVVLRNRKGLIVAHNDDCWKGTNDAFLARLEDEQGNKVLSVCYYGFLPGISVSLNSHGLVQALDSLKSTDWGLGIPLFLLYRKTQQANSLSEARKMVSERPRASAENFLFAQGKSVLNMETTAKKVHAFYPQSDFVHTNHALNPCLKRLEPLENKGSVVRLKQVQKALHGMKEKEKNTDSLKAILSAHESETPVCRHGQKGENMTGLTIASSIIDLNKLEMKVSYGPPCKNKYYRFKL